MQTDRGVEEITMEEVQDHSESEKRVRCMDETTVFIVHDGENCLAPGVAVDGAALHRGTIHTVLRTLYPAATDEEVERALRLVDFPRTIDEVDSQLLRLS